MADSQNTAMAEATATKKVAPDVRGVDSTHFAGQTGSDRLRKEQDLDGRSTPGVTIKPAGHLARKIRVHGQQPPEQSQMLAAIQGEKRDGILQSSFTKSLPTGLHPSRNGFVRSATEAYSRHHHLRIRPDDIWLAILTQLSAYINVHSEELRGSFVTHEGKQDLVIAYGEVMIQDNVVDPDLREWILPVFSTTTENDSIVASIVMMASMQKYFEYIGGFTCGLPSVTLLGEKADYEVILARLDKLRSYGEETTTFANLLTPVIKRFILSFEAPESEEVVDFWNKIFFSWSRGSGLTDYCGWITAFLFWDEYGKLLWRPQQPASEAKKAESGKPAPLIYDGVVFHTVGHKSIPPGFCTVPVKIDEYGTIIMSEMLAGSIGVESTSSGEETADGKVDIDTMQPRSGWWIYEKAADEGKAKQRTRSYDLDEAAKKMRDETQMQNARLRHSLVEFQWC